MLERVKSPLGAVGRVRGQVWALLAAMAITGALMALGVVYLAPAHEGSDFAPAANSGAVVQNRG